MSTPQVYGRVSAALITADSLENRRSALGLLMTSGVANLFRRGDITEDEARRRITTIIDSGQIPNPAVLRELTGALDGSTLLRQGQPIPGDPLDVGFKLLGLAAPFFSTPAQIALGITGEFGASSVRTAVRLLDDPNNILTGQFAPPRPNAIAFAGAVALEQLKTFAEQEAALARIYADVIPETSARLGIGEPVANVGSRIAGEFTGEIAESIRRALNATTGELPGAIRELEQRVSARIDGLDATTAETLEILRRREGERAKARALEAVRQREQRIQQEVTGAITVVDAFARHVLRDARAADLATGTLRAAQSVQQLVSSFVSGPLGVLGFAGGIASVVGGLFGLFGGGPDPTAQRLDEIDRKLGQITDLLIEGFEHLDRRLSDVLTLSQQILQQTARNTRVLQAQLDQLQSRVDFLTERTIVAGRGPFEAELQGLGVALANAVLQGSPPLESVVTSSISTFENHARNISRRPEVNGRLFGPSADGISIGLSQTDDIRTLVGNLDFVVAQAESGVALRDPNPPAPGHWSRAAQGALEFLVLVPQTSDALAADTLTGLWQDGTALKASVLAATNSDLLRSLLDRYEALALRELSSALFARTLDELAADLLGADVAGSEADLPQFFRGQVGLLPPHPFFDTGLQLKYLLSVLAWRVSDANDALAVNPRSVDLVGERRDLALFLSEALARETAGGAQATEVSGGRTVLRQQVREAALASVRDRLLGDVERLRLSVPRLADSRRVRDVDEALLAVHALALSRGVTLPEFDVPSLRVRPRPQPQSVYEVDEGQFRSAVVELCRMAADDFAGALVRPRRATDDPTRLFRLASSPLGFASAALPTGGPANPDGRQTHARIFLTEPFNFRQATDQAERYLQFLLGTFPGIRAIEIEFERLPPYVRRTDAATTRRTAHHYLTRPLGPNDPPSELALVSRESVAEGGRSRFANELWVFTRRSGAFDRAADTV